MDPQLRDEHRQLLEKNQKQLLTYGTSGFREESKYLKFVGWRVGIFIGQMSKNTTLKLGVMITASHNKIIDNGFKIVPPKGGMLSIEEEQNIEIFYKSEEIVQSETQYDTGIVYVGRDTRPSSESLCQIVLDGIKEAGAIGINLGIVTTPQCAFLVYATNLGLVNQIESNQQFFVEYFCNIFLQLIKNPIKGTLVIDGAEGVGGIWIKYFQEKLANVLTIQRINYGDEPHLLNDGCGSEFVQKEKKLPKNFVYDPNYRYASLDGDADRLVYYYFEQNKLQIIEGDRFAILFAMYIKQQLQKKPDLKLSIGIIQTAYANSASTKYITENLGIYAKYAPTGVKYLHRVAHEFDIGIYFEANGHGAVIYKDHVLSQLKEFELFELELFLKLSNQAVGDAIINILMTEFLLNKLEITIQDWLLIYQDYPALSTKLYVKNKQIIKTNYEETSLIEPIDLKQKVDEIMSKYDNSYRTCIRPSGTENVVRIHSEGPQVEIVKEIDFRINELLKSYMEI
ncbi:unnamed protein product [Paramecium pentaurelia]|uniref:phosphoacetylglucosamine mutase n=1 Tax=Paramecium pentaurelia TaxID=43138 RepID=A0A8S1WKM8_9CILI|nr:unnamed protein product [Paramecium pentaurelia]